MFAVWKEIVDPACPDNSVHSGWWVESGQQWKNDFSLRLLLQNSCSAYAASVKTCFRHGGYMAPEMAMSLNKMLWFRLYISRWLISTSSHFPKMKPCYCRNGYDQLVLVLSFANWVSSSGQMRDQYRTSISLTSTMKAKEWYAFSFNFFKCTVCNCQKLLYESWTESQKGLNQSNAQWCAGLDLWGDPVGRH